MPLSLLLPLCRLPVSLDPGDPDDLNTPGEALSLLPAGPGETELRSQRHQISSLSAAGAHAGLGVRSAGLRRSLQQRQPRYF